MIRSDLVRLTACIWIGLGINIPNWTAKWVLYNPSTTLNADFLCKEISDTDIEIEAEADDLPDGADNSALLLSVNFSLLNSDIFVCFCSQSNALDTLPTRLSRRGTRNFLEVWWCQRQWRRREKFDRRIVENSELSPHFTPLLWTIVGCRKYGNGNDIYSRLPSTRANWYIDSGENSPAEKVRSRKGAVSTRSKRILGSHDTQHIKIINRKKKSAPVVHLWRWNPLGPGKSSLTKRLPWRRLKRQTKS